MRRFGQPFSSYILVSLSVGVSILLFWLSLPRHIAADTPSSAREKVAQLIHRIHSTMADTRYQHRIRVRIKRGEYFFDCSGMAAWVLKRAAPGAYRAVQSPHDERPLARHFYQTIAKIVPGGRYGPWLRLEDISTSKPGDVIAWVRPKWFPSKSTGHVAFVVASPEPNSGEVPGLLFRIADASKFRHEDDTRDEGETGFGIGTMLIPTDDNGRPTGYGWVGSRTEPDWVVPTKLVIGRPLW